MKIQLTESQIKRLTEAKSDNQYKANVRASFNAFNLTYKGREIDYVDPITFDLKFLIDIEMKSWGIKNLSVYGFNGPESIQTSIGVFTKEDDYSRPVDISIPVDWENVLNVEEVKGRGVATIERELEINLTQNEEGSLSVESIDLVVYTL